MSQARNALTPPAGVSAEEFDRLLAQGRARHALGVDDVMAVLKNVELSEDLISAVRSRLSDEGIHLDEPEVELDDADLLVLPAEEPAVAPFAVPHAAPAPAGAGDVAYLPTPPTPPVTGRPAPTSARPARRPSAPPGDDGGSRSGGADGGR